MKWLETTALSLGILNSAALAVRPLARFHARLDVLEVRLNQIDAALVRLEKRLDSQIDE